MTPPAPHADDAPPERFLERFRSGDAEAFEWVIGAHHARMLGYARLFTPRREIAEEAVQDVFLALYQQRAQLRSAAALRSWLFTALRRRIGRVSSRASHRAEVPIDHAPAAAAEPDPALPPLAAILEPQAARVLHEALASLDDADRELVTLRYFGSMPLRDLADTLSIPMGTIGGKLNRALDKLRRHLGERGLTTEDLVP